MRQPILEKNQGYTLFIVLIMMLVIALVVVASMQSTNTEMRISSNEADRKYAFSLAEQALRAGEQRIVTVQNRRTFDPIANSTDCNDGICGERASERTPVWKREDNVNLNDNGKGRHCIKTGNSNINNACYMVERLGDTSDRQYAHIFRVTARAWGANTNTVVTLQSYVEYAGP